MLKETWLKKQSAHQMISTDSDGEDGYLTWQGVTAEKMIILLP